MSRFRPSPGTVIACIALVVACTGSATAATLITGKQIKNNSVTTKDVKNKSLRGKDFKPGDLPRGSAGPAGATGPQGPTGPQGSQGEPGLSGVERVVGNTATNSVSPKDLTVTCPSGKRAISAGYQTIGGESGAAPPNSLKEIVVSYIATNGGEATMQAYETDTFNGDWAAYLFVECARVGP